MMLTDVTDQAQTAEDILASQRMRLAALGEAWLAAGATTFGLRAEGRSLAHWPASAPAPEWPGLSAPILVGRTVVGELCVSGLDSPAAQSRLAVEAQMISRLAQLEGELDEMTAALIDAQDHLLALYDLAASTRSQLAVPDTLHILAREAARLAQAEGAFALLVGPAEPLLVEHHPEPLVDEALLLALFHQVQTSASALVVPAASAAEILGDSAGIRNLLFEPIRVRGNVIAGLGLLNKAGGDFGSPDLKLVQAIAEQAGVQIENVLLYQETLAQAKLQHEMELAARIQLALLPRHLPKVAGLELGAHSRPALQVGGDFYDLVAAPDRPFIFAVGDVSGKGMSAALLMAMTRTAIHSQASFLPRPTPQDVLSRSSRELYNDLTEVSMFVTVFIGQYEPRQRRLLYANAGHSPVVYCPAGGPARLLYADDPPLGVIPLDQPRGQELTLQVGDLLLVATDGYSEARNPAGEMFGYDRLLQSAEELARGGQPAGDVAQTLLDAVTEFGAGQPQDDDQTLMVLRGVAL
jgi:sigma-B regulation protein RsbU (phosphoserine phosphatase)